VATKSNRIFGFQKLLGFSTIFRNRFFSFLKNHKWVIASAMMKQPIQLANHEINRQLENKNFQTFLESNQITTPCAQCYATTPSTTTTISDFVGK
jgi:hypothetical protein